MNQIWKPCDLIIGVDVSKEHLDMYYLQTSEHIRIANDKKSIRRWLKTIPSPVHMLAMEATGGQEEFLRALSVSQGLPVHVAHASRVYHFAKQKGHFAKTDRLDAKIIAQYAYQEQVIPSYVPSDVEKALKELASRRSQLVAQLTTEKCRLKAHLSKVTRASITRCIKQLEKELERLESCINEQIQKDPKKQAIQKRLQTFKGVGDKVSIGLVAGLKEIGSLKSPQIAALVGLAPRNHDSGRKIGQRHILGGRYDVRKLLYMSALAAIRHNKKMSAFYHALKARGKPSKVALVAVMRKIIVILNAMIRHETDWENKEAHGA